MAANRLIDYHFTGDAVCLPLKQNRDNKSMENITDWSLDQFRAHYEAGKKPKRPITKEAIFHYVYGVLHDPVYREKYAHNLKREFPRIPFYADFWKWADWGETLMTMHIGYETVEPWPLERIDVPEEKSRHAGIVPKALLRAKQAHRKYPARQRDAAFRHPTGSMGLQAWQPLGARMDSRPAQGKDAERPDYP